MKQKDVCIYVLVFLKSINADIDTEKPKLNTEHFFYVCENVVSNFLWPHEL